MNARLTYWSDPHRSIKVLMIACLVHWNAKSVPWAGEKALSLMGEQGSTGRDIGLRTTKSSSPPEEPSSRILRGYCGAKEFGNPDPFHIKSKAYVEEEEVSEDEQKRSKLPGDVAEDNLVLGKSRLRKEKVTCHQGQSPRASQGKAQMQRDNHGRIVEEQF